MSRRSALTLGVGACAIVLAIGAVAQTPPPDRQSAARTAPGHVNNADYDPQPYFIDGVEYKPYVPAAAPAAPPPQQPQRPPQTQPAPQPAAPAPANTSPGLRPYVPVQSTASASTAPAPTAVTAASSSSRSSRAAARAEKKTAPAGQRPRYGSAVIEVLDKVTAESVRFEAPIGKPLRYKSLVYTVRACETSASDEAMQDVFAYIQIRTAPDQGQGGSLLAKPREVFRGWSFASSPSLNPVQHPNYDAWVVGCRNPLDT